jgi:hypothetical protein
MSKIQDKLTRLNKERSKKIQRLSEGLQQQMRDILEDEILELVLLNKE